MTEAEKRMKKYMNAIERRLNLPLEWKARVMADLASTITGRREAGQSDGEIMAQLGTPKEVAAELNRQMAEYTYRKSPWRWAALAVAIVGGVLALMNGLAGFVSWFLSGKLNSAVGVIGGADGPTAVFITSEPTGGTWLMAIVLIALGAWGFWRLSRCGRIEK